MSIKETEAAAGLPAYFAYVNSALNPKLKCNQLLMPGTAYLAAYRAVVCQSSRETRRLLNDLLGRRDRSPWCSSSFFENHFYSQVKEHAKPPEFLSRMLHKRKRNYLVGVGSCRTNICVKYFLNVRVSFIA